MREHDGATAEVRFSGGPHNGLVVEAPRDLAVDLPLRRFEVTSAGRLFDLDEQARIPGVRVLVRPGETPAPAPAAEPAPAAAEPVERALDFTTPAPVVRRAPTVAAPVFQAPRTS